MYIFPVNMADNDNTIVTAKCNLSRNYVASITYMC